MTTYLGGLSGGNAGSLAEIVEYNKDNPVEGLKYTQGQRLEAAAVNLADPTQKTTYDTDLATGKTADKATIDAILSNGTAGDTSDDIEVIAVPQGNALVGIADRAGYPVLTVPPASAPKSEHQRAQPRRDRLRRRRLRRGRAARRRLRSRTGDQSAAPGRRLQRAAGGSSRSTSPAPPGCRARPTRACGAAWS